MYKRNFTISALSHEGNIKRVNEDSILVKIGENEYGDFGLFVIADGMGGMDAGDVASGIVTHELKSWWDNKLYMILSNPNFDISHILENIKWTIGDINKKIINYGHEIGKKTGTTLSVLFIYNNKIMIFHIGDSRIYKLSQNKIYQLTEDHSWVADQVKKGYMTKDAAKYHPKRNVLLKCLGIYEPVELFYKTEYIDDEDIFVLCSDGFYNYIDENELIHAVGHVSEKELQESVKNLLELIKIRGADDNISIIVIKQNEVAPKRSIVSNVLKYLDR